MGIAEFETNFAIAMIVSKCSDPDGRKEMEQLRGIHRAIDIEGRSEDQREVPFDPENASPEELDRWLRSIQE
jgi:hypothetical protein